MIHHVQGNLLTSDCNVIAHQSNCMGGFGSGIAGQIRKQFPEAYKTFAADQRTPQQKLGSLCHAASGGKAIFNLYGQFNFGPKGPLYTRYPMLDKAVGEMLSLLTMSNSIAKIGMPYLIGCDLAGGDWDVVSDILEERFDDAGMDLWLYEYHP